MVSVSAETAIMVIGAAATLTTAIFWGSFLLGRLWNRLTWVEKRVEDHETAIRELKGMGA